jgi:hypothetical protein
LKQQHKCLVGTSKLWSAIADPAIPLFWSVVATKQEKSSVGIPNTQTSVKLSATLGSGINSVIDKVMETTTKLNESCSYTAQLPPYLHGIASAFQVLRDCLTTLLLD